MSTTNLFVELVVVGSGAVLWICLLISAALGLSGDFWTRALAMSSLAIPALAVTYLLGIVVDRLADMTLGNNHATYKGRHGFYADRAVVLKASPVFAQQYEYSRIRQRVCRGWVINSVGILVAANCLFLARPGMMQNQMEVDLVASLAAAVLGLGSYLAWKALVEAEHKRLAQLIEVAN